jgi:hypothetical protein
VYEETKAIVAKHFTACRDTGRVMLRKATNRKRAGAGVGHVMKNGYVAVMLPKVRRKVYAHHVVIFSATGVWPPETGLMVDHVDRNKRNNALDNLRLVTAAVNAANHGASCVRAYRVRLGWRYRADFKIGGVTHCRAGFTTEADARAWMEASRRELLGQVLGSQVGVSPQLG